MSIEGFEVTTKLTEFSQTIFQARETLKSAVRSIASAKNVLDAMPASTLAFRDELDAEAALHVGNAAWDGWLAEKDEFLEEFQALTTVADNIQAAVDAITIP